MSKQSDICADRASNKEGTLQPFALPQSSATRARDVGLSDEQWERLRALFPLRGWTERTRVEAFLRSQGQVWIVPKFAFYCQFEQDIIECHCLGLEFIHVRLERNHFF